MTFRADKLKLYHILKGSALSESVNKPSQEKYYVVCGPFWQLSKPKIRLALFNVDKVNVLWEIRRLTAMTVCLQTMVAETERSTPATVHSTQSVSSPCHPQAHINIILAFLGRHSPNTSSRRQHLR
jgi:hypothetical protein